MSQSSRPGLLQLLAEPEVEGEVLQLLQLAQTFVMLLLIGVACFTLLFMLLLLFSAAGSDLGRPEAWRRTRDMLL